MIYSVARTQCGVELASSRLRVGSGALVSLALSSYLGAQNMCSSLAMPAQGSADSVSGIRGKVHVIRWGDSRWGDSLKSRE